jgi:uncharacterized protein YlxW (UPF0749 family)
MPDETALPPVNEPSRPTAPETADPLPGPQGPSHPEDAATDDDPGSPEADEAVPVEQEQPGSDHEQPGSDHEPSLGGAGGQELLSAGAEAGNGIEAEPEPAEPVDLAEPAEPAEPADLVRPEPAEPVDLAEPAEPAEPADLVRPEPAEPVDLAEPAEPAEPADLVRPEPAEPADLAEPAEPAEPAECEPAQPEPGEVPVVAAVPTRPVEPAEATARGSEASLAARPVGEEGRDSELAHDEGEFGPAGEHPTAPELVDAAAPAPVELDGRSRGDVFSGEPESGGDEFVGPASGEEALSYDPFGRGVPGKDELATQPGSDGSPTGSRAPTRSRVPEAAETPGVAALTPRMRLLYAMRPRANRAQLLAMLLCFLLGLAGFLAVKQNQSLGLASMRQSDLVSLLDNVTEKSTRLEDETRRLQAVADRLKSGSDKSSAALQAAQQRLELLGILAGTSPAVGPGIQLTVTDPRGQVSAAVLLDTVQELRDAGAEAIQIGDVRVVASTSFVDGDGVGGVRVDGTAVPRPYVFLVIGDSQTLSAALGIPGGVLEVLKQEGATGKVDLRSSVTVSALRPLSAPQYARPATSAVP